MINDPHDINGLDPEDIGLKSIMGVHFVDETKGEKSERKPSNTTPARKAAEKPTESLWMPPMPKKDIFDKLKQSVKCIAIFGGIEWVVFCWQNSGLMDERVAVPTMLACMALAGFGVGQAFGGKK